MKSSTSSGRDLGAALVDLGLLAGGRVDDREVGPRLALDLGEVVEDGLLGEALEDPRLRCRPPASPVAMTGRPSSFSARATLTPLPPATVRDSTARWRRSEPEVGHGDRAVDRGIQGDGEDHVGAPLDVRD